MNYSSRLDVRYSPEVLAFIRGLPIGTKVWWDGKTLSTVMPRPPAPANKFIIGGNHLIPWSQRIRTGDHVKHHPSEETWVVAWADYQSGYLAPCGWPTCQARLEDCTRVRKGTVNERLDLIAQLGKSGRTDAHMARQIFERDNHE